VPSQLTLDRVRRDIEVVARAGLDVATFVSEFEASLRRAVPHVASCFATLDPTTRMLTSTYKFGALQGCDGRDADWARHEYGDETTLSFAELADRELPATSVWAETDGDLQRSGRHRDVITPCFGFGDELKLVGRHDARCWGGANLFREGDDEPFTDADLAFVAALSGDLATGLRSGVLVDMSSSGPAAPAHGPAVVILGSDDQVRQVSMGAESVLAEVADEPRVSDASGVLSALVTNARRFARGEVARPPWARVRMPSGRWLLFHAAPLAGPEGASGDVVVTIEEARPPEVVPLVVEAFGLTPRERDVTELVLQGVETKEIAAALHLSRYTVQDHLKSVFDKAGVRSRRELTSRIFFDQYVPRLGGALGSSGWFAPAG
jgi:DNA-binding CsgD family transcriptional regulator